MIDRVVQRPFLLWQAEAMVSARPGDPDAPLPEEAAGVGAEEIAAAKAAVAAAIKREKAQPLTVPPKAADRRGKAPPPIEQRSYFPRDSVLSMVQAAVERYLMEHASGLVSEVAKGDVKKRRGKNGFAAVADYELNIGDDQIPPERASDRRLLRAFEITDPRWVSSLVAMGWGKLHEREDFPGEPAEPRELKSDARVVVVGDWASGNSRARSVAKWMRDAIDAALAEGRQCHVVHLGDTYYAGWAYEYHERFLPYWPVEPGEQDRIGSWSLPGNHDMYTGGHGYYTVLLKDERFSPYHRSSSRFSLENEHWQLLGLDTSWDDHALKGDQAAWVERKLKENRERRTMLLSHHQPFSAYGKAGQKLREALREPLAKGQVDAWLWGHEHRCAVYEPTPSLAFPCCIGHGGVPVYAPGPKPPGVKWQLDRSVRKGIETWAFCGFSVLDFDGASIAVQYVNEFGEVDHEETIQ